LEEYPEDRFVPLIDTLALVSFTQSSMRQLLRSTDGGNIPTDNIPQIISNLDANAYYDHGTNNQNFDRSYRWTPDISAMVEKFTINIAFVMDMTAFTSNNAQLTSVRVTISEVGTQKQIYDGQFPTGLAVQDAVEISQFVLCRTIDNQSIILQGGVPVDIRLRTVFAQTATNTIRTGMVPFFATTTDSRSKFFSQSGILFHLSRIPDRVIK